MEVIAKKSKNALRLILITAIIWALVASIDLVCAVLDWVNDSEIVTCVLETVSFVLIAAASVANFVIVWLHLGTPIEVIRRDGDTLYFSDFVCKIGELTTVDCRPNGKKKPKYGNLTVRTESKKLVLRYIERVADVKERLLALMNESKSENPNYEEEHK